MLGLGIRLNRYSYTCILQTKEFVVNIPTEKILKKVDFCGITSGKEIDKFSEIGLTPLKSLKVKPPLIKECPVNMECFLRRVIKLGSHHLFLGEVAVVHIDSEILDEKGCIDFGKAFPISYLSGEYWSLGKKLGTHGFSKYGSNPRHK
jgi:flavin reductase (DIM6/NTAB) family NADH-FMN oxidoreductase RutF